MITAAMSIIFFKNLNIHQYRIKLWATEYFIQLLKKNEKNLYMVSWKRGPSYTDKWQKQVSKTCVYSIVPLVTKKFKAYIHAYVCVLIGKDLICDCALESLGWIHAKLLPVGSTKE